MGSLIEWNFCIGFGYEAVGIRILNMEATRKMAEDKVSQGARPLQNSVSVVMSMA